MSAPGWMPLHVAEYLGDTGHLSTVEHGAYMLLIMHYWQKRVLPDDDRKLARICRMTVDDFAESRDTLSGFFGPGWAHKRIDAELAKADLQYEKRASAGRKGGIAKATASNATAMPEQCSTNNTDKTKEEDNKAIALSSDPVPEMVEVYHEAMTSVGCPAVLKITPSRKASALQRLKDCGGMEGWRAAMARARGSPFLTGASANGWKADFDFFMQAKSFNKLLEGSYDARSPSGGHLSGRQSGADIALAIAHERLGRKRNGNGGPSSFAGALDAERDGTGIHRISG